MTCVRFAKCIASAIIMCFSSGATALGLASFGRGTGPIVMTNTGCRGSEDFLINCTFSNVTHFDTHAEDAGVRCVTSKLCVTYMQHVLHVRTYGTL